MEYSELLATLVPIGNDTFEKESFEPYHQRVGHLLPNVPLCVFENWIYRHYSDIDDYSSLDFRKMKFKKEVWLNDRIYNDVNSYEDNYLIENFGYQILENRSKSWLQNYMLKNCTWPVPIIVFENNTHSEMGKPYHLLEGHLRTNYFRTLYKNDKGKLIEGHEVWKVTVE